MDEKEVQVVRPACISIQFWRIQIKHHNVWFPEACKSIALNQGLQVKLRIPIKSRSVLFPEVEINYTQLRPPDKNVNIGHKLITAVFWATLTLMSFDKQGFFPASHFHVLGAIWKQYIYHIWWKYMFKIHKYKTLFWISELSFPALSKATSGYESFGSIIILWGE